MWRLLFVLFVSNVVCKKYHEDRDIEDGALTREDFERSRHVRDTIRPSREIDDTVLFRPDRFEGDIVPKPNPSHSASSIRQRHNMGILYSAVSDMQRLWPGGVVPYTVSGQFESDERALIASVVREFHARTCLRFISRQPHHADHLHLAPDDGCFSSVGRTGGRQLLSLGHGCISRGVVIHEFMHALGFFHEQSRTDRDDFVKIFWDNIADGMEDQFQKFSAATLHDLGIVYDYASIMHYGSRAFSKNGMPTILPRKGRIYIGQRRGFSDLDLRKANSLYTCPLSEENLSAEPLDIIMPTKMEITRIPRPIFELLSTPVPEKCKDLKPECRILKSLDFCGQMTDWMRLNCAESCNFCQPKLQTTDQPGQNNISGKNRDCVDKNGALCAFWEYSGLCGQFKDYAKDNCRKSCQMCHI